MTADFEKLTHRRAGRDAFDRGNPPPEFERGICPKRAYRRRRDAVKAAKRSTQNLRVYVCHRCGMHHLTSQRKDV